MTRAKSPQARRGDFAERMVEEALALAVVVRTEGAEGIGQHIDGLRLDTDPEKLRGLLVALAAMVDVDRSPQRLLSWVTWDEAGEPLPVPCEAPTPASHAGFVWHTAKGGLDAAHACGPCEAAERLYQRERKSSRRSKARAQAQPVTEAA